MRFADLQICFFHRSICFLLEIFPGICSGSSDGGRGEGPTWLALDKKFLFLQKSRNLMKVGRSHYFTQTHTGVLFTDWTRGKKFMSIQSQLKYQLLAKVTA